MTAEAAAAARPSGRAEVIVVGGGIVGASIAYHLARRGMAGVLLLERERIASGSTSRTAGGVRTLFDTPTNVALSRLAQPRWRAFGDELGEPVGHVECGYVCLAASEETLASLQAQVRLVRGLGVPAGELGPDEVRDLVPGLATAGLLGAVHCPAGAVVDPVAAARAYARRAADLGASIREGTPVADLVRAGERVVGVRLTDGQRLLAGTVVLAAGVWSSRLLEPLGLALPARRFRREIFESERQRALHDTPFVSDLDLGWYFRSRGDRLWMSGSREPFESWSESVHWGLLSEVKARAARRLPLVTGLAFPNGWAGLYALTPDGHALLGPAPGVDGLLLACGDSGHGAMHAPATGQLVAELLLDGRITALDAAPLDPTRFDWQASRPGPRPSA